MFKDYLFFSNNLQDAARQILEAQEAQAKKENVEAIEPDPMKHLRPMGQLVDKPAYEDDPTIFGPPAPKQKFDLILVKKDNVPNEKDDDFIRILKAKRVEDDKAQEIKNWEFREDKIEKQRLARQRDAEEARREGTTLENYYRMKERDNERKAEREEQEQKRRQNPRGVPMSELA